MVIYISYSVILFLSGFVLNCNFPKLLDFLKLKIKRILLPYLWLSIITWIFVECIYQSVLNLDYHSFQKILGIFICAKSTPYYLTLWFIISLFFAQIIIYLLSRLKNKKIILMFLAMLFLLGIYISSIYEPGWILVSDTIPMASFFVGLGFSLGNIMI
ncbi:acyltransferase family protein [Allocoprobacillus halotolerans]|uniref:acyltransferase family protein n=1 Tax=Allocoprobacillus halotolerans TaxID=2944914 RepID=UPI00338F411C